MSFVLFRDATCARPYSNNIINLPLGTCLNLPAGVNSLSLSSAVGCPNSGTPILYVSTSRNCPSPDETTGETSMAHLSRSNLEEAFDGTDLVMASNENEGNPAYAKIAIGSDSSVDGLVRRGGQPMATATSGGAGSTMGMGSSSGSSDSSGSGESSGSSQSSGLSQSSGSDDSSSSSSSSESGESSSDPGCSGGTGSDSSNDSMSTPSTCTPVMTRPTATISSSGDSSQDPTAGGTWVAAQQVAGCMFMRNTTMIGSVQWMCPVIQGQAAATAVAVLSRASSSRRELLASMGIGEAPVWGGGIPVAVWLGILAVRSVMGIVLLG